MKISARDFFDHYISAPLAKDLSLIRKILTLVLSALIALPTLGILHIRSFLLRTKNITNITALHAERAKRFEKIAAHISNVSFKVLMPHEKKVPFSLADLSNIIEKQFIQKHYAKNLPPEEAVTVPVVNSKTGKREWRKWNSLTRTEKIAVNNQGTREHNQLGPWTIEPVVNRHFFAHGQKPFLSGDPRESHGNDHAARASIAAAISAYLYQEYHPKYNVSTQDIAIAQVAAAGHDSGRQTEGPDVYDEKSAEQTVQALKELGVHDKAILHDVHEAIANKDSDPLDPNKSLIAKCVQNADCLEFARLLLTDSPIQSDVGFENSRKFLDIYNELSALSRQNSSFILKNGLTYGDFCYELDTIRKEMNSFIYQTHNRDFREKALVSGKSYYQAILDEITPYEYPSLYHILLKIGIKDPIPDPTTLQKREEIQNVTRWIGLGLENIAADSLIEMHKLMTRNDLSEAKGIAKTLSEEIQTREKKEEVYLNANSIPTLVTAYADLPPLLKKTHFHDFLQRLPRSLEDLKVFDDEKTGKYALACLLEVEVNSLQQQLENIRQVALSGSVLTEMVDTLKTQAEKVLKLYHNTSTPLRRPEIQTTVALALGEAAHLYLNHGHKELARETLDKAATSIQIEIGHPLYDLEELLKRLPGENYRYVPTDCGLVRKRKMGILKKEMEKKPYYELSLELPPAVRVRLETTIKELIPAEKITKVPAHFYKKEPREYVPKSIAEMKEDLKIAIAPGVTIQLGCTKEYWTQYHLMRIRVEAPATIQDAHKALSSIGLPTALMPTREEDVRREMMSRSIAFRFPQLFYTDLPERKSVYTIYNSLTEEQKKVVNHDINNSKLSLVGNNHFEVVQPQIAEEAWQLGVRAVGCFIKAGASFESAAETMVKIVQNGLFSSQERYQHGIPGFGCAVDHNYRTGSGNQVFARILTDNLFEEQFDLSRFAVEGQIFVMMDPKVLERMPYSYIKDRAGIRNPYYQLDFFTPEKQLPEFDFRGAEKMKERLGFAEHIQKLKKDHFPTNETMFDLNVGSHYFTRLCVWSEQDRIVQIRAFQKAGIYQIGGHPIEKIVVTCSKLHPELVDNYYEQNPYKDKKHYDPRYL